MVWNCFRRDMSLPVHSFGWESTTSWCLWEGGRKEDCDAINVRWFLQFTERCAQTFSSSFHKSLMHSRPVEDEVSRIVREWTPSRARFKLISFLCHPGARRKGAGVYNGTKEEEERMEEWTSWWRWPLLANVHRQVMHDPLGRHDEYWWTSIARKTSAIWLFIRTSCY